jgi:hypothetical protein
MNTQYFKNVAVLATLGDQLTTPTGRQLLITRMSLDGYADMDTIQHITKVELIFRHSVPEDQRLTLSITYTFNEEPVYVDDDDDHPHEPDQVGHYYIFINEQGNVQGDF